MSEYLGRGRIGVPRVPAQAILYYFYPVNEWIRPRRGDKPRWLTLAGGQKSVRKGGDIFVSLAFPMHSGWESVPTKGPGYSFYLVNE